MEVAPEPKGRGRAGDGLWIATFRGVVFGEGGKEAIAKLFKR